MAGATSNYSFGGNLNAAQIYAAIYGFQGQMFSLDALRNNNPFLYYSNIQETHLDRVTVSEPFTSELQTLSKNGDKHTLTPRPEQNRTAPLYPVGGAEFRTNIQLQASSMTMSEKRNYINSVLNSFQRAIYNNINYTCQNAINGDVAITDIVNPSPGFKSIPLAQDGVITIDATGGFDMKTLAAIRATFFKYTQNNGVDMDDYYLILPQSVRGQFLSTTNVPPSLDYKRDIADMKNVETVNGSPIFSLKGDFFQKRTAVPVTALDANGNVTATVANKDCVLGYAILRGGITFCYNRSFFPGFINDTNVQFTPEEINSIQNSMYGISIEKTTNDYRHGFIIKVEGFVGAVRTFSGAVVRIALPIASI